MSAVNRTAWLCATTLGCAVALAAQTYSPPASDRMDINLDPGWRFIRQDVAGAQASSFDDSSWTNLNLPHTWNNLDGEQYGGYYQGIGWYRVHYILNPGLTNRHFFFKFDGAYNVADVYVNGTFLGEHQGGFGAFVFDATTNLNLGADNVIAVKVSNAFNTNIPPLSADFTFFGGLYRDVHLLVTDPVHVSPLDYASPGVYLKPTNVGSNSAALQVTTLVSNASPAAASVTLRAVITDAATNIVTILTNLVSLPAGGISNVVASTTIANPHLWNGLSDPYLYQVFVEIYNESNLSDLVSQPLGFRWFSVDPTNGFFLNGQHYDLHGVNMHQDWLNCGWALTNAQRDTNFVFIKEIGATFLRLSHYEHNDYTYQLADENGVCVWSEVPLINYITASSAFYTNTLQQLREMIRQRYNHPSVICWSVYNEITSPGPSPTNLISQEIQLLNQEDTNRLSTAASDAGDGDPTTFYTQLIAFNKYYGWYVTPLNGIASWADNIHANYPNRCVGVSEYGAGASIYQHSENPTQPANTATSFHPEEWQNIAHETNWLLMKVRPFLWCKLIWNEFDFASAWRNEGDTSGRNDKGLATYDRLVHKDAFYFYKANWTTNPMVYITGHTFTNRLTNFITAKVYANCDSVELFVNGVSQGSQASTNCIFLWPVALASGSNYVQAVGSKGASKVSDSLSWIAPIAPFVVSITSPLASLVYLNSTNDTVQVSAAVTNAAGSFAAAWNQVSGPGTATFGNRSALATTVHFTAPGLYALSVTASTMGGNSSASLTVVVGTNNFVTNGLIAWWKMDETSGLTAADSSGHARNATLTGTSFTTGYLSNALQLAGTSGSYGTFAAADGSQQSLAVWVKATGTGGGSYPFVVSSPSYRLIFRLTGTDVNSVGFATWDQTNGDYDSGPGTISQNTWYHVAVTFDRNHLSTPPVFYVNGTPMTTSVLASPGGTNAALAGPGYIGNRYDGARGWNGLIDDLRIYNRILNANEVQLLAAMPLTNRAPVVNAGTNQAIIWPAAASLSGTVSDDGNPNPPGLVAVSWSQLSGPGVVAFGNANALATSATFSLPGVYLLQLAASDGQVQTVSTVTINAAQPVLAGQFISFSNLAYLSWPNQAGWHLQCQTSMPDVGLSTNWVDVFGTGATNSIVVPMNLNEVEIFYRLVSP